MRFPAFVTRNSKELLRDPLSLVFCIAFPLFLLVLVEILNRSLPAFELFEIQNFAPGTAVFSFSFLTLFPGMLIGKDRSTSFLIRLFASPLTASDYILGYSLPLLPIALMQSAIFFAAATFLGLPVTVNILVTLLALIPSALLFIDFGLLFGSIFSDRQVGGGFSIFAWIVAFLIRIKGPLGRMMLSLRAPKRSIFYAETGIRLMAPAVYINITALASV